MQQNYVLKVSFSDEGDTEPVLLAEMKTYLAIAAEETFHDALITQLIKTARQQLENFLNISLIDKTVTARLQNDAGFMQLPYTADTIEITSVKDDNNNDISSDTYALKGDDFCGYSKTPSPSNNYYDPSCTTPNYYTVVYDVSYDDGIRIEFKTAIMQQVAWLYQNQGDDLKTAISPLVKIGLQPYRRVL